MDVSVQFRHPTDGRLLTVSLDDSITAQEAIAELIFADFIAPNPQGYGLAIVGGDMIVPSESFAKAGVKDSDYVRVLPATDAGGGGIPGLKNSDDTYTRKELAGSRSSLIMLEHFYKDLEHKYEDLHRKYEIQAKQLEDEKVRSNNNFTSTLLLLISQVVLSIGTNLLTSNSLIAIPVMIAGVLQTLLALYLTFKNVEQ
jgi:hypothetical protein